VRLFRSDIPVSGSEARKSAGLLRGKLRPDGISDLSGRGSLQGYIAFHPCATRHFSLSLLLLFVVCVFFFEPFTCSCLFVISLHPRYVSLHFFTFLFSFDAKNSGFFRDYLFLGLYELNCILLLIFSVLGSDIDFI
jgi:hypothetical protein